MAIYDRDYLTTLPLLYEKASEYSEGDWNKYNNDVGDTILKLLASSSHTVDYYFRKFLSALILPNDNWDQKALIWELTGYKPNYLRADYLMVQLYWPDCGLDDYVPIYQYTPFKIMADGNEYTFLCAQDYFLQPLTTRANIRLVNGSLETIDQDYKDIRNNRIKLTDDDIDYDLVTVVVSGIKWTQVRNVFYSPKTERIFSVHKEEDGTYIYLHKSWQEYIDSYDPSFMIYFVKSYYNFTMFTDECMTVEFKTELYTLGGDEVSQYYKIIPLLNSDEALDATNLLPSTTEGNRAITVLDFENNAALFPGIASCKAYDWNTPEVCNTPFEVALIACDDKGKLSDHMKQVLKAYLESICSPLLNVNVIEPRFAKHNLMVLLDIGDYRGTLAELEIKNIVTRAITQFYEIGNLKPGRVVKTKELNSLILHSDSRIYFATTSFMARPSVSPILIPVLGSVIVITSAEAFTYYDHGFGKDKGYIELQRYDWSESKDKYDTLVPFVSYKIKANAIVPIDKLPLQLFEFGNIVDPSPVFNLGSEVIPITDFSYGEGFVHILETGGDPEGPEHIFVYETDGSTNLISIDQEIETTVDATLQFTNYQGVFYVDPDISITVKHDDVDELKAALAKAFNSIPGLQDGAGNPFNISADDIQLPDSSSDDSSDEPVYGNSRVSHVSPLNGSGLDITASNLQPDISTGSDQKPVVGAPKVLKGGLEDVVNKSVTDSGISGETAFSVDTLKNITLTDAAISSTVDYVVDTKKAFTTTDLGHIREKAFTSATQTDLDLSDTVSSTEDASVSALVYSKDAGTINERQFIYIPYNKIITKDLSRPKETQTIKKVNFTVKTTELQLFQQYTGFSYSAEGRYVPGEPTAIGEMEFIADVNLSITDKLNEFTTVRPEIYDETAEYNKCYYVKEKDGNPLHWYFVNTSPVQSVAGTYEIGYGIYVKFNLLRDSAVYVEADPVTTRGFIYSHELTIDDFSIHDTIN